MRKSEGDAFCGSETVFAIENHTVAAVEEKYGGAGGLVFALVDHEVAVLHVERNSCAFTANGVGEGLADVEIHGVAEFVGAGSAAGLDACREVAGAVTAETAAPQRAEKIFQSLESKKIDGLVGDFEAGFGIVLRLTQLAAGGVLRRRSDLRRLLRIDEAFLGKSIDQFLDEVADLIVIERAGILEHFAHVFREGIVGKKVAFLQGAEDGFAEGFHGIGGVKFGETVVLGFKAALQEKIAEAFHEFVEVDDVGGFSGVFSILDDFHEWPSVRKPEARRMLIVTTTLAAGGFTLFLRALLFFGKEAPLFTAADPAVRPEAFED